MAQTTAAMSGRDLLIEFSTDDTTYTDISGFASKVSPKESERETGEEYTFDGDTAIIRSGKRKPLDVEFSFLYTEGASDAFSVVQTAHVAGTLVYVRWSYKGGASGDKRYKAHGPIKKFQHPEAEASSGKPLAAMFSVYAPEITDEVIA